MERVGAVDKIAFGQLPRIVKVSVGIALLGAWVALELLVIEPLGLNRYMPFYRVQGFCVYDLAATLSVVGGLWRLS